MPLDAEFVMPSSVQQIIVRNNLHRWRRVFDLAIENRITMRSSANDDGEPGAIGRDAVPLSHNLPPPRVFEVVSVPMELVYRVVDSSRKPLSILSPSNDWGLRQLKINDVAEGAIKRLKQEVRNQIALSLSLQDDLRIKPLVFLAQQKTWVSFQELLNLTLCGVYRIDQRLKFFDLVGEKAEPGLLNYVRKRQDHLTGGIIADAEVEGPLLLPRENTESPIV